MAVVVSPWASGTEALISHSSKGFPGFPMCFFLGQFYTKLIHINNRTI